MIPHWVPLSPVVKCAASPGLKPGHLTYRADVLSTELTGPPHIFPPAKLKFGTMTSSPAKLDFILEFETEISVKLISTNPWGSSMENCNRHGPHIGPQCCQMVILWFLSWKKN
ncbi:hypothetical protein DPMN_017827 [Dreissena polymorpha]|uniref:Uncharacterized protein n=1 Tax=Dreissena polymorpha TaxID=45954 RepID=A0A9D4NC50_DREPO|nr:hypothetical protein DPMN_017827 [Dreissena polymorpha]